MGSRSAVDEESQDQKAIRLLKRQVEELQTIRGLHFKHPEFKAWRDTTTEILVRFLGPTSPHTIRFRDTRFFGPSFIASDYPGTRRMPDTVVSQAEAEAFQKGCETTDASLRAATKHIEDFGVYVEPAKAIPAGRSRTSGVTQTFQAPVTMNQAIATDGAIQKIGHIGDPIGASLKEIAGLFQQSEDLTPRQVREGLAGIESLALEVQKPESKRNWKSVFDYGQSVLGIADKATDLANKLAPYTPAVIALMDRAKHLL